MELRAIESDTTSARPEIDPLAELRAYIYRHPDALLQAKSATHETGYFDPETGSTDPDTDPARSPGYLHIPDAWQAPSFSIKETGYYDPRTGSTDPETDPAMSPGFDPEAWRLLRTK